MSQKKENGEWKWLRNRCSLRFNNLYKYCRSCFWLNQSCLFSSEFPKEILNHHLNLGHTYHPPHNVFFSSSPFISKAIPSGIETCHAGYMCVCMCGCVVCVHVGMSVCMYACLFVCLFVLWTWLLKSLWMLYTVTAHICGTPEYPSQINRLKVFFT